MLSFFRKRMKGESGFTLVELLIVVVIIGILTAIAIPTYSGIQNNARKAVGDANAAMLNRGISQAAALNVIPTYSDTVPANKTALAEFLGLENEELKYVQWNSTESKYEGTTSSAAVVSFK